ncbi:MAG TPA: ATP-binding protein [Methanocorpusculum sp.]|nr:ATP-binding protein [Methanocorpusculum sp.]
MNPLLACLDAQNPWWKGGWKDTSVVRLSYLDSVLKYLMTPEIIVISGIRRSGKTTLMQQTIGHLLASGMAKPEEILFVSCDAEAVQSLEHPLETVLDVYRKDISPSGNIWIFLDEIQQIRNFARTLKHWHDTESWHIVVSGSSSHLLESETGALLGGRYLFLPVFPLAFSEYLSFNGVVLPETALEAERRRNEYVHLLKQYLRRGGFPALVHVTDESLRNDYLKAYYDSIVYRDIVTARQIRGQVLLKQLYSYLLSNIANPVQYSALAKMFSTDILRIGEYIGYAEEGWLLHVVRNFSYSVKKQSLAPKKLYVMDLSLRSSSSFVFSEDIGRSAENAVAVELLRRRHEFWYWKKTHEIDFVVKQDDRSLLLINVCFVSTGLPDRETRGFVEFQEEFPDIPVQKLILTEDYEGIADGVPCIPLWKWLTGTGSL